MPPSQSAPLKAVLFDLDGTLVDSYPAIQASVNFVRARYGLPPLDEPTVRAAVGNGVQRLLESTIPGGSFADDLPVYMDHHPSVISSHTVLLPGVEETLRGLVRRGVKLGVCSNKPLPLTMRLLADLNMADWFAAVMGPESVPRRKPAPDMLLAALQALGVVKEEAMYVGDMTVDVETARAAGVLVWVVATGSNSTEQLLAAGPDRLMTRFDELLSTAGAGPATETPQAS
ncbi:MAG: HAD family hydrolase [Planctomycetia bacterium]